jgi:hypothetical protein
MVSHDLLFDSTMRNVDTVLGDAEGLESLSSGPLDDGLRTQLEAAATLYRDHWWGLHNQANQFWISAVGPLVRQFGPLLVSQISQTYDTKWPEKSVRVDVTEYANWAGAYTFGNSRVHTLVSSFDPSNQGFAALEVLFHEATHGIVDENEGRLAVQIAAACKLNNVPVPEDLWHAVIFFTAGELVRRDLATVGVENYEPYADKNGLYVRVGWTRYESALQLFWIAHLNGTLSLDGAVSKVISALTVADNHNP